MESELDFKMTELQGMSFKISEHLLKDKEKVKKILLLISDVKPLIGDAIATSNPENRGKVYALATLATELMPLMLMELCPLEKFNEPT